MANRGIFAEDSSDACDYFQRKSFGRKRTRNEPLQTASNHFRLLRRISDARAAREAGESPTV